MEPSEVFVLNSAVLPSCPSIQQPLSAGHAPDGLVEAIELPDQPAGITLQWHPE